jgi:hypothetical protein
MTDEKKNPAAGQTADGVRDASQGAGRSDHTTGRKADKVRLTVRLRGEVVAVRGRVAQTLALLIDTGARGFTSGEASPLGWARRTSHYVRQLRLSGFPIQTHWETAGDARVGRYVLTEALTVVERCGA